ncbi:MAG TPA: hypothetical protein VJ925_05590 [Longimicrobiales bacterium]|nr:hypothetical protein [Longimicrobiales bacterium]
MMLWLIVLVVLMIPLTAIVLDSRLGQAMASRLERGQGPGTLPELTQERISYLEGEIERLDQDVRRLEEESRFMQQLLSDRPEPRALPESDDSD